MGSSRCGSPPADRLRGWALCGAVSSGDPADGVDRGGMVAERVEDAGGLGSKKALQRLPVSRHPVFGDRAVGRLPGRDA